MTRCRSSSRTRFNADPTRIATLSYDAVSLEQQRGDSDNGGSADTFQDTLGTEEERYELVE